MGGKKALVIAGQLDATSTKLIKKTKIQIKVLITQLKWYIRNSCVDVSRISEVGDTAPKSSSKYLSDPHRYYSQ